MRPLSLTLKGFTCFSQETYVSFDGMDVFAITGRTGSGKTTITDAMCYALYGKVPRGTDVSKLIAHDASQMYVSLEFVAGGRPYRAARSLTLSRTTANTTSKVQLDRQLADGEWEPLENRVREMNEAIESIVGLDYRAFTRCVLLPQGRFQEMLTGSKEDRRKVLEDLLDVGIYGRMMTSANQQKKPLETQAGLIEQLLATTFADATPERLAECRAALKEKKPALKTARQRRDAAQAALAHAGELKSCRRDQRAQESQLKEKQDEIAAAEVLAAGGEAELERMRCAVSVAEAELTAVAYDGDLHRQLIGARATAQQLERLVGDAEAASKAAVDRAAVTAASTALAQAEDDQAKAKAAAAEAEHAVEEARRAHAAAHLRRGLRKGDACPVCNATVGALPSGAAPALDAVERAAVKVKAAEEKAFKALDAAKQRVALEQQKAEQTTAAAASAAKRVADTKKELAAQLPKALPSDAASISAKVSELDGLGRRMEALRKQCDARREECAAYERKVATAAAELAALQAAAQTHAAAAEEHRRKGDDAIAQLQEIVQRWKWNDIAELMAAKNDPHAALASMHDDAQRECDALGHAIGALEQDEKRIQRDIAQAEEQRVKLEGLRRDAALYAALADLLQANKFREWFLGEAMLLLAHAASTRLETLDPDRRYGLDVAGGEFVVIDHWQADAERSPETLSGGETFVASLALALALAEQLPRIQTAAAGALESLFLDEGFGTLDAHTLDPVMSALDELRAEDRLVGIITHVPELAQRIETRIEIDKSPQGSTLRVVGSTA
ncbi:MAG: SMC family ATPase [Chloroflexota bacterium]|nr:SMC family ATPase [Chloroflexota bacterium]